jgi:hypothetical protein
MILNVHGLPFASLCNFAILRLKIMSVLVAKLILLRCTLQQQTSITISWVFRIMQGIVYPQGVDLDALK